MSLPETIASLFIKCQSHKELAWRAHIAKRDRAALEQVTLLILNAKELQRLLAEKAP